MRYCRIDIYNEKLSETKRATITMHREELLYDIKNSAYITANVIDREQGENARHSIIDIGEDGNVDRVTRLLDQAFEECVFALLKNTYTDMEDGYSVDDTFKESDTYVMDLVLPAKTSKYTVDYLSKQIHEYMVRYAIAQYIGVIVPSMRVQWEQDLERIKDNIKLLPQTGKKKAVRTLYPF